MERYRVAKCRSHHGIPAIYPHTQFIIKRTPRTRLSVETCEVLPLRPEVFEPAVEAVNFAAGDCRIFDAKNAKKLLSIREEKNHLNKFGCTGEQACAILGTAPVEGRISGIVDIPNSCATPYLPAEIPRFQITDLDTFLKLLSLVRRAAFLKRICDFPARQALIFEQCFGEVLDCAPVMVNKIARPRLQVFERTVAFPFFSVEAKQEVRHKIGVSGRMLVSDPLGIETPPCLLSGESTNNPVMVPSNASSG